MKRNMTPEEARDALLASLSECDKDPIYLQEMEQFRIDYPGVPEPQNQVWSRNDKFYRTTDDWIEQLKAAESALTRAAENCRELLTATNRTTLEEVTKRNQAFSAAIFLTEDLQTAYNFKYPMPTHRNAPKLKKNPKLADFYPKLLLNTSEQIVIWMPTLPPKKRGFESHIYTELTDLLFSNDFSHFRDWHCDFIHVFHMHEDEDIIGGILDVDNYAYKPIIDALALALRTSDGADRFSCSMYNFISATIHSGCYIRITKRSEKIGYLENFADQLSAQNP